MTLPELEEARQRYFTRADRKYEREIAAVYRESLDKIRADMSKIYERYSVNGILTRADMTKYNRLATLEKNVLSALSPAVRKGIATIDKLKPIEYGEAYFRTAWAVDVATGVNLTWGPLDKAAIAANLDNPFYLTSTEKLTGTLKGAVRNTINNGLTLGQSYPEMMKDIKDLVNLKNFETMRILRTELHDAQEAGISDSYDTAKEQGINGKVIWVSTLDGNTRDTHQQMDGVERDEDGMFRGAIGEAPYPGWEGLPAGERINCIPGDAIPIGIDTEKLYRRWYVGEMIHLKTSGGLDLRVTPNHPICTDKGWIAAHLIDKSYSLVSVGSGKIIDTFNVNVKRSPPVASKVFNFLRIVSVKSRIAGSNDQFHGDGGNGKVDVISVNRHLWDTFYAVFIHPFFKFGFTTSNIRKRFLLNDGPLYKLIAWAFFASNCIMGLFRKLGPIFLRSLRHSDKHSIGSIPGGNSVPNKTFSNSPPVNVELFSYRLFGDSSEIKFDDVCFVERVNFSGHVYNLQSKYGFYGLYNNNGRMSIVHNCRCDTRFEIEGFAPEIRRSREDGLIPQQTYEQWKNDKKTFK